MEEVVAAYKCPICQEIAPKSLRISPCSHEVCVDCSKHLTKRLIL